jgi:hypothetical protein
MSTTQKLGVGLLYASIAVLGAGYAVFEDHQTHRLAHFLKEIMPAVLILILVLGIYGLVQTALSILRELVVVCPKPLTLRSMWIMVSNRV